jgi:hypothetical protein
MRRRRDAGPIQAGRVFASRSQAEKFARSISRRHPEVRINPDDSGRYWAVLWTTRSTRDARRDLALDKKKLWKEIDADQRRKDREKLVAMRERIRQQKKAWPEKRAAAKSVCSSEREKARARALEIRARHKEQAAKEIATEHSTAKTRCSTEKSSHRMSVDELRAQLKAEKTHQRQLRAISRSNRSRELSRARRPGLAKARERQGESDDEVRSNIPPDLIPLFEKIKRTIKASPRKSRTEAFLEYVESHPGEEYEAIEDKTDALVRELERQQRSGRRDPKKPAGPQPGQIIFARFPTRTPSYAFVGRGSRGTIVRMTPASGRGRQRSPARYAIRWDAYPSEVGGYDEELLLSEDPNRDRRRGHLRRYRLARSRA